MALVNADARICRDTRSNTRGSGLGAQFLGQHMGIEDDHSSNTNGFRLGSEAQSPDLSHRRALHGCSVDVPDGHARNAAPH
jgi:hypothetical protein